MVWDPLCNFFLSCWKRVVFFLQQKCILCTSLWGTGLSIVLQGLVLLVWVARLVLSVFTLRSLVCPPSLSHHRRVRLRSRNAVIDCWICRLNLSSLRRVEAWAVLPCVVTSETGTNDSHYPDTCEAVLLLLPISVLWCDLGALTVLLALCWNHE
jgi:hypothetical protein